LLHHVEIYVSNLAVSRSFWSELLGQIGYQESSAWDEGFTLKSQSAPYLTFIQVADKHRSQNYHRCEVGLNHLAFAVDSHQTVDKLRQFCLDKLITVLYDERYPYANGGSDYYALFIEDPDRIKVEFVAG